LLLARTATLVTTRTCNISQGQEVVILIAISETTFGWKDEK